MRRSTCRPSATEGSGTIRRQHDHGATSAVPPVALVTGAGNGIGACLSRRLADRGVALALLDIDADALENTAGGLDTDVLTVQVDVSDPGSLGGALARVGERFGSVGWCAPFAGLFSAADVADPRVADRVRAVNLHHVATTARWAQDTAAAAGHGSHVVISGSNSGLVRRPSDAYSASKRLLLAEAQRLRWRGRRRSVRGGGPHRVTVAVIHETATNFGANTQRALRAGGVDVDLADTEVAGLDRHLSSRGRDVDEVTDELLAAVDRGRTSVQLTGNEGTGLRTRWEVDWRIPAEVWWQEHRPQSPAPTAGRASRWGADASVAVATVSSVLAAL